MKPVKQLSPTDTLFIAGESRATYNHTAGLLTLDTAKTADFDFDYFREKMIERLEHIPQFKWKLHELPLSLDLPYWVEDTDFSYRHHIKRTGLPAPGDLRALSEIVEELFSRHMDRNKPLWEAWFIEGLEGGRCAVMLKLHHCLMDGQGAIKLLEILCDLEPDASAREVPTDIAEESAGRVPSLLESSLRTSLSLARKPAEVGKMIIALTRPALQARKLKAAKEKEGHAEFLPHSLLNANVGAERGCVFGSLPIKDILAVKKHFGVSVNEVVLALASSALRVYLTRQGSVPEQALRTTIPLSLRTEDDEGFANRVTTMVITLATDIEDPVKRLQTIHRESERAKNEARAGGMGVTDIVQVLPPLLVSALVNTVNPKQTAQMLGANLAISNVRGSPIPVYLAGARVETLYPISVITPGMAMNITCVGYHDKLDFGLTLDPDVFPERWSIMQELENALADYLAIVGKVRKKPKTRKAKTKAKPKVKAKARIKTGAPTKRPRTGKASSV